MGCKLIHQRLQTDKYDYNLFFILLAAAILRFWKFSQIPFMHDEFSALFRTDYNSFYDLIRYGVMENDSHPAGVQIFLYYWVKLFGFNEFWIKLPFAVMGVASVYLIYKIGTQWFNRTTGLLSAAFFTAIQYSVFYSQLARPYSAGLFFVLLFVYFWNRFLFEENKTSVGIYVGFVLSAWLASLMHIFSTAEAGLIFITGLFFVKKSKLKGYLLSGIASVIIYLPHLPVFLFQMNDGGIGGWLGKPESDFVCRFFAYTVNYSWILGIFLLIIVALPFFLKKRNKSVNKKLQIVGLLWFVIPFALAYLYSVLRIPVIQFSTLYFSFPFFVIVLFSFFDENTLSKFQTPLLILCLLIIETATLVLNRKHYEIMYHQGFDQIAVEMKKDKTLFSDSIALASYSLNPKMAEFYQKAENLEDIKRFSQIDNVQDFSIFLENVDSPYFGFGWTNLAGVEWEMAAISKYPYLIEKKSWFTSSYLTLSNKKVEKSKMLLNEISLPEKIEFNADKKFGKAFIISKNDLEKDIELFGVSSCIVPHDSVNGVRLVIEIRQTETDSLLHWQSSNNQSYYPINKEVFMVNGIRLSNLNLTDTSFYIKTYVWNQKGEHFTLEKSYFYTNTQNANVFGIYDPL